MKRNYQDFITNCQPLKNTVVPTENFDGLLFDTSKEETEYLNQKAEEGFFIATLTEEDGQTFIQPGAHFVNRLGYFLLKTPLQGVIDL